MLTTSPLAEVGANASWGIPHACASCEPGTTNPSLIHWARADDPRTSAAAKPPRAEVGFLFPPRIMARKPPAGTSSREQPPVVHRRLGALERTCRSARERSAERSRSAASISAPKATKTSSKERPGRGSSSASWISAASQRLCAAVRWRDRISLAWLASQGLVSFTVVVESCRSFHRTQDGSIMRIRLTRRNGCTRRGQDSVRIHV